MSWMHDESELPPFLAELTDDSPEEAHISVEITEGVIDKIVASCTMGEPATAEQIREMILAGMVYGWQFAQQTGAVDQKLANRKAAAKRQSQAAERHDQFRAAWEAAIAAGRDVSIAELARELGVPRATAYRAVNG